MMFKLFDVPPIKTKPHPNSPDWVQPDLAPLKGHLYDPEVQLFDAVPNDTLTGRAIDLVFTGNTRDYFQIWVVTQLLTVLTLGIYGPWSRARRAQYLAAHWELDGQGFEVRYRPLQMLQGRLLVFAVLLTTTALIYFSPILAPLFVMAAFLLAPKLLANSFAFRWQTMSYRGINMNATRDDRPLRIPLWLLGFGLAILATPLAFWERFTASQYLPLYHGLLIFFPALYFWPKATSALTHLRFAAANYGQTSFALATTSKEIYKNMWKRAFDWKFFLLSFTLGLGIGFSHFIPNRDLGAIVAGLCTLGLSVWGVTFARGRRINFVLHRLSIGGLRFTSTMHPNTAAYYNFGYAILAVCTLGLSLPWSMIHYSRWRARQIHPVLAGDWTQFTAAAPSKHSSGAWDELANSFDIELGL